MESQMLDQLEAVQSPLAESDEPIPNGETLFLTLHLLDVHGPNEISCSSL